MPVDRKDLLGHAQRHGLVLEEGSKHGKIVDPESGRVLATIPVLFIYLFLERYLVGGMTAGSEK